MIRKKSQVVYQDDEASDEYLLAAIKNGEIGALDALYTRYYRLLYALAYRKVADRQVAEDLLQDTFLAVWRHAITYSPQAGSARGWLVSILQHRAIDHLRKIQRRGRIQENSLEIREVDEKVASADVWDAVWQTLQRAQVRLALLQIPPEQRRVIELAYFQGCTQVEIARSTHAPLGTVKARIRLGLRHLKYALEEMGLDKSCAEY